ncbi:MAG: ABC transporter permease [Gammaproteobacteria bacterium]|nr:ABC transporter permease [Gammaproteobacteria bacterium]
MFFPLSCCIGLKYTRAQKRNHFISFISLVSMFGIALGVMVLITVLSVMNGFDFEIKNRVLTMMPEVTLTTWENELSDWPSIQSKAMQNAEVTAAVPFVQAQGMLTYNNVPAFGVFEGVDPKLQSQVSPIASKMVEGKLSDLVPGRFGIILGKDLAETLGVSVGDKLTLMVPQTTLSAMGVLPELKQFTVVGLFKVGYQYDTAYAILNIQDLQKLMRFGSSVSGMQLKVKDIFKADAVVFLMLLLIIAVAAFNMLSSLVMLVTDKQSDIAILRTLGAETGMIMRIFMVQGLTIALIGIAVGVVAGILLAEHITAIVNLLEQLLHTQFLNTDVYYIDFVPSKLELSDVFNVALITLAMSFLATLYPSWKASRVNPAEALRYE